MILLIAVAAGAFVGCAYAKLRGRVWQPPVFRSIWLVALGFIPQLIAFYFPYTRRVLPTELAAISLVCSQLILLVFTLLNLRLPGMPILMFGLTCNLAVILANGGFMPLTIEAAAQIKDQTVLDHLTIGDRVSSKDILLPESMIILPGLADRFVAPLGAAYQFAFSLGDIFIAVGTFLLLLIQKSAIRTVGLGDS